MQNALPPSSALAAPRPRYDIVAVCSVLALLILALDLAAPMGIASGALYVTVVMFSLFAENARTTWTAAWAVTALTLGGMAASHYNLARLEFHEDPRILVVNRAVALILIWLTASLGVRQLRMKWLVVEHGRELERMNVELNKIARHDALTNVANRRYFDEILNLEFLRALRDKTPLSLLMIDVDFFKKYNDLNGHQAGDSCLVKVAQTIQSSLRRPADVVARYGGEEFAVILPATNSTGAVDRAEAIRKKIEALKIAHPHSFDNTSVTVSVGVASTVPSDGGAAIAKLVAAADAALYEAKQAGRNIARLAA